MTISSQKWVFVLLIVQRAYLFLLNKFDFKLQPTLCQVVMIVITNMDCLQTGNKQERNYILKGLSESQSTTFVPCLWFSKKTLWLVLADSIKLSSDASSKENNRLTPLWKGKKRASSNFPCCRCEFYMFSTKLPSRCFKLKQHPSRQSRLYLLEKCLQMQCLNQKWKQEIPKSVWCTD